MEVTGGVGFGLGGFKVIGFEGAVGLWRGAGFAFGGFEVIGLGRATG